MPKFVKHSISFGADAGARTFYFLAPDGTYTGIETETGVNILAANSTEQVMPTCKVEELLHSPVATRRKIRYGTGTGKKKYTDLIVSAAKAAAFDEDIKGKGYKGGTVIGTVEPLDAVFR
jgi:hypothetical protein